MYTDHHIWRKLLSATEDIGGTVEMDTHSIVGCSVEGYRVNGMV